VPWSAIVVIGNRSFPTATIDQFASGQLRKGLRPSLAGVEIFGRSVLERMVSRLAKAGAQTISVFADSSCGFFPKTRGVQITIADDLDDRWSSAQHTLHHYARQGIANVLVAELGAYVEFDFAAAIQFHQAKGQPITVLHDSQGPTGYWITDTAHRTTNRSFAFPLDEREMSSVLIPYTEKSYVNRLADAHDLRRLVVDAFYGRCSITPSGREIRPGVWIDEGARVHKTTRLVAPIYVGRNTRLRPAAVVTRFSNIERHCDVGEGSVVADSSVLAHTGIGRALEVSGAVVSGTEFVDLGRNVTLTIEDPHLLFGGCTPTRQLPNYGRELEEPDRQGRQVQLEHSQYWSRAAGRLLEVFRGEV